MAAVHFITLEEEPVATHFITLEEEPVATAAVCPLRIVSSPTVAPSLPESVYRRRRLVATAALAATLVVLLAVGRPGGAPVGEIDPWSSPRSEGIKVDPSGVYVVEPGDTLWDIARSAAPGRDPRAVVHELAETIGGASLQPGQRIVIGGGE